METESAVVGVVESAAVVPSVEPKAKRKVIPVKEFLASYKVSSEAGHTMAQFAESIGLAIGSAIARVSSLRGELKDRGMKPAAINQLLPSLTRKERDGGNRAEFLDSLVASTTIDEIAKEETAV